MPLAQLDRVLFSEDRGLGDAFNVRPQAAIEVKRIPEFWEKTVSPELLARIVEDYIDAAKSRDASV